MLLLPQRRIHDVRIGRVDADIVAARVLVLVEHFLERAATVGRSKDPTLRIRPVRVSECSHEYPVWIVRVDVDHRDHLRVAQAEMRPRPAGVGRLVDAVADGQVGPNDARAGADVDDVRIRRRDGDRADRSGRLVVEERPPRRPVVGGAPHAAVVETDVEDVRLARHAVKRPGAARARRADLAPVHRERSIGLLPECDEAGDREEEGRTGCRDECVTHQHHRRMKRVRVDEQSMPCHELFEPPSLLRRLKHLRDLRDSPPSPRESPPGNSGWPRHTTHTIPRACVSARPPHGSRTEVLLSC